MLVFAPLVARRVNYRKLAWTDGMHEQGRRTCTLIHPRICAANAEDGQGRASWSAWGDRRASLSCVGGHRELVRGVHNLGRGRNQGSVAWCLWLYP
jgi:hypothetical protein